MKRFLIAIILSPLFCAGCHEFQHSRMDLLTLDFDHMLEIREEIEERSPEFHLAYQRLLREADHALLRACGSVVHKENLPPSGDKKDYMSLATYWWPDPDSPTGLPYIRRDGYRNPEGDEGRFDDIRSSRMVQDVSTLSLAWFYSQKPEYASKATEMIRVWFLHPETAMNPNLNYAQAIPGKVEGRGVGIIDTRNYVRLIDAFTLLEHSKAWKRSDTKGLKQWFSAYTEWLLESDHGQDEQAHENNHGTWYDVQLVCYASFTGNTDLAMKTLRESSLPRIEEQIDSLGKQNLELSRTKSLRYSIMNLHAFILLGKLGDRYGINFWEESSGESASLKAACDFLFSFVGRIEAWPYQQITAIDASELIPLAEECWYRFGDPYYQSLLENLSKQVQPTDRLILTKR